MWYEIKWQYVKVDYDGCLGDLDKTIHSKRVKTGKVLWVVIFPTSIQMKSHVYGGSVILQKATLKAM